MFECLPREQPAIFTKKNSPKTQIIKFLYFESNNLPKLSKKCLNLKQILAMTNILHFAFIVELVLLLPLLFSPFLVRLKLLLIFVSKSFFFYDIKSELVLIVILFGIVLKSFYGKTL